MTRIFSTTILASVLLAPTAFASGHSDYRCTSNNPDHSVQQFRTFSVKDAMVTFEDDTVLYDRRNANLFRGEIKKGTYAVTLGNPLGSETRSFDAKSFFTFTGLRVTQNAQVTWVLSQPEVPYEGHFPAFVYVKLTDGDTQRILQSQALDCEPLN